MTTSVSVIMGSREKTAKTVRNTPKIHGAYEIAECVLTCAAWSLAATDEEKTNVDTSLALASSHVVLLKQSPFNYVTLAPMKSSL